jgi:YegS/Rv2252/BmrU family lipid kinase
MARSRRRADVERAARVLQSNNVSVELEPTAGPRCADRQARQYIEAGFDTIIACGGDGTIHDVLQGTTQTPAVLGVLPLGTANSLAADLGLARDPVLAARQLLNAAPRRIAVGRVEYQRAIDRRESRYFTVAAGVGVDAALFYKLNAQFKQRWGMAAYVSESFRQWIIQKFQPFRVEWVDAQTQERHQQIVTQLLAVRIADFGGVLRKLAPGADLTRDDLRLVLFKTASRARYLRFVTGRLVGQDWADPQIDLVHATEVHCRPQHEHGTGGQSSIYTEADGEILGKLPVSISIVPEAFNLLIPPKS